VHKVLVRRPDGSLIRLSKALVAISLIVGGLMARFSAQTVNGGPVAARDILVKFRTGVNANARDEHTRQLAGPGSPRFPALASIAFA
jgi:hypothetical protein